MGDFQPAHRTQGEILPQKATEAAGLRCRSVALSINTFVRSSVRPFVANPAACGDSDLGALRSIKIAWPVRSAPVKTLTTSIRPDPTAIDDPPPINRAGPSRVRAERSRVRPSRAERGRAEKVGDRRRARAGRELDGQQTEGRATMIETSFIFYVQSCGSAALSDVFCYFFQVLRLIFPPPVMTSWYKAKSRAIVPPFFLNFSL